MTRLRHCSGLVHPWMLSSGVLHRSAPSDYRLGFAPMRSILISRGKTKAACAALAAGALMVATPAGVGASGDQTHELLNARGIAVGDQGRVIVGEGNGTISKLVRSGPDKGLAIAIAKVPNTGLAPAVDMNDQGEIFAVTTAGEGDGAAKLYRFTPGERRVMLADIGRFQRQHPDRWDLEGHPAESNPFGVAALDDGGVLVADAAGNEVLRVFADGRIVSVAKLKPREIRVTKQMQEEMDLPPRMMTEAVATSVAVGPGGDIYIGELRGFPATPGTSWIWQVDGDAQGAICRPKRPHRGDCTRAAGGLTSIVDLEVGENGSLYAVELSKMSWLAGESGAPGSEIGALIRIAHDRNVRRELAVDRLVLPGGVAIGPNREIFVTTPIFGPTRVVRADR